VPQATGNVTVVNAYQFERSALNVMLSFDADNKIAGMNIAPRPAPPAASDAAARASSRSSEESATIGAGKDGIGVSCH